MIRDQAAIGVVISHDTGALPQMLMKFTFSVDGRISSDQSVLEQGFYRQSLSSTKPATSS